MGRRHFAALAVLSTVLSVGGCARTRISSLVAPEARDRTYHRLLVVFPVNDLEWRRTAEEGFGEAYDGDTATFIPSYQVFFAGRQYSNEEISGLLAEHRVDAALVIILGDAGVSTTRTPTQTTAQCTIWTSTQGCVQAFAITTGGYDISKPWANFTAVLLDASSGTAVWAASARTGGNAFAGTGTLLRSMAKRTMKQLRADGLVP